DALRDQLSALPIEPARDGVHGCLAQVADRRESARHVAVESAKAGGELALVARREEQRARLVRIGHEQHAANARLQVLLGDVRLPVAEDRLESLQVRAEDRLDL